MPVPDKTSAEAIDYYTVGTRILASKGTAWDGVRLSVFALPPFAATFTMPAVNEPFIAWITSGKAEAEERESAIQTRVTLRDSSEKKPVFHRAIIAENGSVLSHK